jgi:DNA-binding LacI/PurR family transcriptional regulator
MAGIADVARAAGVSKSTASRALSGSGYVSPATRERVAHAAKAMGFVVSANAASLVTGRTRSVAVIIPYLNRWFFAEVLDGIESALIDAGYDMVLYRLRESPEERRRIFDYFIVRKRVDAVIAVNIALSAEEVALLRGQGTPVVGIGGSIDGAPTLSIDDEAAARLATEHLIGLGHRRIVHLGGDPEERLDFRVHSRRLQGFHAAMADAGLARPRDFRVTDFTIQGGYACARDLLGDPAARPTAVVAGCDEIAIGAIVAARELGIRVPQDLSVVGIDDHDLADMFDLTTVRQEPSDQGRRAVRRITTALDGGEAPDDADVRLPISLRVRRSTTAPAPAA